MRMNAKRKVQKSLTGCFRMGGLQIFNSVQEFVHRKRFKKEPGDAATGDGLNFFRISIRCDCNNFFRCTFFGSGII